MDAVKCITEVETRPKTEVLDTYWSQSLLENAMDSHMCPFFGCGLLCLYGATVRDCQGNLEHARRMTEMNFTYVSEKSF